MNRYIHIILLTSAFCLFSCSIDKLGRQEASKQIIANYGFPIEESRNLTIEDRTMWQRATTAEWDKYRVEGLLSYERFDEAKNSRGTGWPPKVVIGADGVRATLSEKGREFVLSDVLVDGFVKQVKVKTADLIFGDITGIMSYEEFNTADVEYTVQRKNITPFGRAMGLEEETMQRSVTFTKYDDGWRID